MKNIMEAVYSSAVHKQPMVAEDLTPIFTIKVGLAVKGRAACRLVWETIHSWQGMLNLSGSLLKT
jgi:hypothetical protein